METIFLSNVECDKHINPIDHPEQVLRLKAVRDSLNSKAFHNLKKLDANLGKVEDLLMLHSQEYFDQILKACSRIEKTHLDGDTIVNKFSFLAALYGVGAVTQAVDLIIKKEAKNVFCATRPPGHHAEKNKAMGFCLFGNVAIGAKHALKNPLISRVAILDFDVHHGNGTQNLIWNEKDILLISSHQMPLFPGSGSTDETGEFDNVLNIPLVAGTDGTQYLKIMDEIIIPKIEDFHPDMIILSAGFDSHMHDPLANLNWLSEDYYKITKKICVLAKKVCKKRIVSCLEGGYNLKALGDSVAFHVKALMEG